MSPTHIPAARVDTFRVRDFVGWKFDNATFARSASSFDNPDHVDIVIHNYRWRLGVAEGESKYADLEGLLAKAP